MSSDSGCLRCVCTIAKALQVLQSTTFAAKHKGVLQSTRGAFICVYIYKYLYIYIYILMCI